jgi:uncharacterized protein DUF5343
MRQAVKGGSLSEKHPYANVNGGLIQLLDRLRKSFPTIVDADLLKKLAIAPKNESYIINVVRFLGLIDDQGKGTAEANKIFSLHEDQAFQQAFAAVVKKAYSGLFDIYKDETWTQTEGKLISYFRQTDQSSEIVGGRQASTFKALASYSGRSGDVTPTPKSKGTAPKAVKTKIKQNVVASQPSSESKTLKIQTGDQRVALTVRVEINLPAGGDKETYDRIFKSIRENLMNG